MDKKRTAGVLAGLGFCLGTGVRLAVGDNAGDGVEPIPATALLSMEGFLSLLTLFIESYYLAHMYSSSSA